MRSSAVTEPELRVHRQVPAGVYEPVAVELLHRAVSRVTSNRECQVTVAIGSHGAVFTVAAVSAEQLASGLQTELEEWANAAADRAEDLRQLADLDQVPMERVGDLMAWHDCVLRQEHTLALLNAVRDCAQDRLRGEVRRSQAGSDALLPPGSAVGLSPAPDAPRHGRTPTGTRRGGCNA